MTINIFYEGHTNPNGAASNVEHLYRMLDADGRKPMVYKIRQVKYKKPSPIVRMSDIPIWTIKLEEALDIARNSPSFISQLPFEKHDRSHYYKELLKLGVPYMLHSGPGGEEAQLHLWALELAEKHNNVILIIREAIGDALKRRQFSNFVQLEQPYVRIYDDYDMPDYDYNAVNVGRVASEKNTDVICAANLKLAEDYKIKIFGDITGRIFEYRKLRKLYPNWKDDWCGSPQDNKMNTAQVCRVALHAVDLTLFDWDGGHSQYTFLEMMDAGANIIIHKGWYAFPGEMKEGWNSYGISNVDELVDMVMEDIEPNYDAYSETLANHTADNILPLFLDVVTRM